MFSYLDAPTELMAGSKQLTLYQAEGREYGTGACDKQQPPRSQFRQLSLYSLRS